MKAPSRASKRKPTSRLPPRTSRPPRSPRAPSHIVGIGGSAGSLEPLERFFRALQSDTSMCFVVVTHRDPRSKGMMAEILARFTALRVCEAAEGTGFERGVVYVVPSDRHLDIRNGCIALRSRPTDQRARTPIDSLFRAIARDRHERSVGVVLSGMGSDGTLGLREIKENLGIALVQAPASAAYDGMPSSAISAGLADFVGAPENLAEILNGFVEHALSRPPSGLQAKRVTSIDAVLAAVRGRTGHDFTQYKKNTIVRRIERRMNLHHLKDVSAYVELLARDAAEIDRLFSDLLIGVTRFFRDPDVFEVLKKSALPLLLRSRPAGRPLRAWVAGCATGEEAYSLAITLREYWEEAGHTEALDVQIYATDLDGSAIARARVGTYPRDIAVDVSPARLARFFVEEEAGYRVKKDIRDMVVFAPQNLISDPPFTRLDILFCRNVLIYLEPELQRKLLPLFLYALTPSGILVLGVSEGILGFEDGFAPVNGELKVFRRRAATQGLERTIEFPTGAARRGGQVADLRAAAVAKRALLPEIVQRAVVEHVAPPVVVVDKDGELLFSSQRTGRFLEPPAGKASINVFAMAREGLALPLRNVVRKALERPVKITKRGVRVATNGHDSVVDLTAWALREPDFAGNVLIAFVEVEEARDDRVAGGQGKGGIGDRKALSNLRQTKAQLDAVMAEMAGSQEALKSLNEELQSTNEELQSTNEELQSTNEELTTSKEEMQSMNEELLTLNAELQTTNEQCATTNDDMRNLLNSSQIPTIFLDNDLRLKRFTVLAPRIARLIPTDIGRPVTDIAWNLHYETLARDVKAVLDTLVFKEAEVHAVDGSVYTMRIHPYRTIDDVIDGVVMTFVDITAHHRASTTEAVETRDALMEQAVGPWPGVAYVEDVRSGRTLVVSAATESILGYSGSVLANATEDFWRKLRRPGKRKGEVTLRRSDDEPIRYKECIQVLTRSAEGRPTYVLHFFRRRPDTAKGANGGGKKKAATRKPG